MKTASEILAGKPARMITIDASASLFDAIQTINTHRVGAIVVTDDSDTRVVGIWTERDLLQDIFLDGFDPHTAIIGDYMTTDLQAARHDATLQELKEMFLSLFVRHLFVEKDGRYIGLLSSGDVMRASLLAQDAHIEALKAHTSWQYYETWAWAPAK